MNNFNSLISSFVDISSKHTIAISIAAVVSTAIFYWYYTVIYIPHTYGPLSKIPGDGWPVWGLIKFKFTILFGVRPQYVDKLHKKYGKIVLVGKSKFYCL
jgi:hypothetical protein